MKRFKKEGTGDAAIKGIWNFFRLKRIKAIKYRIRRDTRNLNMKKKIEHEEDCYKPVRVGICGVTIILNIKLKAKIITLSV